VPTPLDAALAIACRDNNLDLADARLIHHYSNAVYLLPAVPAIARIATGANPVRLRANQTVTSWLGQQGFAATTPLPGTELVEVDDATTVTFWTYYPQPEPGAAAPLTSGHLGTLIKALQQTGEPPNELADWKALESLERALGSAAAAAALTPAEHDWLRRQIADTRAELADLTWPLGRGLIHGDAWAGNLLWDTTIQPNQAILCDWDSVSHGPREVDLIPTWHAAARYGRDETWIQAFVAEYGYDLRDWDGYDTLLRMRDLAQIPGPLRRSANPPHAAALRQRLAAIQSGDRAATWVAL
jgi:Ser/Thr protein kinase RdoA (MazF antagonist)